MTQKLKTDAAGNTKLVPRKSPPRKDKIFRRLEASVPRVELEQALAASPSERAQTLFAMLCDPAFRKSSLPTLAAKVGLRYTDVLKLIRDYRMDQGLLRMTDHLPAVMEDVAIDSKSSVVTCPSCEGLGEVWKYGKDGEPLPDSNKLCVTCDGAGKLRKVGDADARKLMFEPLKLTGQRGPLVAAQFNVGTGGGGSIESEVEAVESALSVRPDAALIDVVPVTAKEDGNA